MRFPAALLIGGMLVVPVLLAENTTISGYVTRSASPSDFDVNGIRVRCDANTNSGIFIGDELLGKPGCPKTDVYVGEPARVKGSLDQSHSSITAESISFVQKSRGEVSGSAVINELTRSASSPKAEDELTVGADGYRIFISKKALIVWVAPLHSLGEVKTGDWIEYEGRQRADGAVIAEKVRLAPLVIGKTEEKYRKQRDFDPSKVPASARQSTTSMYFLGVNPKRFPPYEDAELEARVDAIGNKLIPAWQRELPDSDPARIHFHFQLISTTHFREALALSSGVILVPQQVVARMQNDSQLAAVLADGVATALERQTYRHLTEARSLNAGVWAADAAGFFVPGVGLLAPALCYGGGGAMRIKAEHQSGRVALELMHEAGYDINQAPVAWWLLGSKQAKPVSEISLPRRAAYLYSVLGERWNNSRAVADRR